MIEFDFDRKLIMGLLRIWSVSVEISFLSLFIQFLKRVWKMVDLASEFVEFLPVEYFTDQQWKKKEMINFDQTKSLNFKDELWLI